MVEEVDTYQDIEQITRMVIDAIQKTGEQQESMTVPVGVSARHIHLKQKDVETLFGEGYQLTRKKELMGGQFAANEQCTIVGLKLRAIENVRILGPVRKKSQVEISATDARTLGINAPLRQSGDTAGSAPIALIGPKGAVYLEEGCIVAARHIHMTPAEALSASLKDGDYVSVRMGNDRGALLDHVKIRVDESFSLEMHIDTDEANACQVRQGDLARIVRTIHEAKS